MRELYYGRHGQTFDLLTGHRSRRDTVLTKQGWNEARRAGGLLVSLGISPSLIVCSELPRAVQSAGAVADVIGYDKDHILYEPLLNERLCGEAEGMLNLEIKQRWPGGFDTVPGAETAEVLQGRAAQAAAWLRKLDADVVLVIGHGTIGRAIVRDFENRPYTDEYNGERALKNGQIVRLYPSPTIVLES